MSVSMHHAAICALAAATLLAGCSKPAPPPTDQPPEPQARHTELRDAINEPLDKARAVEKSVQDAAEKRQADIDAKIDG